MALEATAPAPAAANLKQMLETARKPEKLFTLKPKKKPGPGALATLFGELFGPRMRFLVGAVLLTGCLVWLYQNDLLSVSSLLKQAQALSPFSTTQAKTVKWLELPLVPSDIAKLFGTVETGAAGLILVVSGVFGSRRLTLALVPAAAALFVAPWMGGWFSLPSLGPTAVRGGLVVVGLALAVLGFLFLRNVRYSGPRAYDDE